MDIFWVYFFSIIAAAGSVATACAFFATLNQNKTSEAALKAQFRVNALSERPWIIVVGVGPIQTADALGGGKILSVVMDVKNTGSTAAIDVQVWRKLRSAEKEIPARKLFDMLETKSKQPKAVAAPESILHMASAEKFTAQEWQDIVNGTTVVYFWGVIKYPSGRTTFCHSLDTADWKFKFYESGNKIT